MSESSFAINLSIMSSSLFKISFVNGY